MEERLISGASLADEPPETDVNLSETSGPRLLKGFTVAIVGADGSGKSTVARRLTEMSPAGSRYMYMGASIDRSNISLPTSRLLTYLKRKRVAPLVEETGALPPAALMTEEMKQRVPRGRIVKAIGVINRSAEEWYRQLFVWAYRLRGFIVICDRHFLYEYFPNSQTFFAGRQLLSVRIHAFLLRHFYPRPHITFFLDAPPEALYARKPEWSIEHLERQRIGINEQGRSCPNFIRIDATRPVDEVVADVAAHIARFRGVNST